MLYIPTRRSQRHWTVFSKTVVRMAGWKRGHDEMYVECVQRVQRLARVELRVLLREWAGVGTALDVVTTEAGAVQHVRAGFFGGCKEKGGTC